MVPLEVTTAVSLTYAAIQKKPFGSDLTTLIILNEELDDIMKIVKSLEDAALLVKGIREIIINETKEKKFLSGIFSMLLGKLGAYF